MVIHHGPVDLKLVSTVTCRSPIDANGIEEHTYEMDVPPRKNNIVRLNGDVYNVVEMIW